MIAESAKSDPNMFQQNIASVSKPEDIYDGLRDKETPEEKVAKVAIDKSEIYKKEALKAEKEAAVSKKVANRAM